MTDNFTSLKTTNNSFNHDINTTDNPGPIVDEEDGVSIDNFADHSFETNYNDNSNNNNSLLCNSTQRSTLIVHTNTTLVPTTSLVSLPLLIETFSHEYLDYDSAFNAGNLSNVNFDDILFYESSS
ncbi:3647_t:CDS:1 [Ambispora leptoticha]|uniref:3647_t:CDS:1 n=1 Tax=Ambispora leptoticha TaxID=144679 RepID=A0A9N8YVZ4_9GLOM|nr:3647_t:CDS:1 [Ambispora leptoticha]